jgi:HD superfamily phosphohydrolase
MNSPVDNSLGESFKSGGIAMRLRAKSVPSRSDVASAFEDRFEFQDEILGAISLNGIERDLVDTPEFQRLFRISQLGFVDLVYQCANHTRGMHSIGCCHWTKKLIEKLNQNALRIPTTWQQRRLSVSETILIRLGALLHDIPHGPYAHDIEKKSHLIFPHGKKVKIKSGYGPYEKHDDFENNPILYLTIFDEQQSVVARVLQHHSPDFWSKLQEDAKSDACLAPFVKEALRCDWPRLSVEILPQLLFHLLIVEKVEEAKEYERRIVTDLDKKSFIDWGLGPKAARQALHEAWYQPYRHDIIGDTLSADLLDYLQRDLRRLGMQKSIDLKLLDAYVTVPVSADGQIVKPKPMQDTGGQKNLYDQDQPYPRFRCAIDLADTKRGAVKMQRLNELFRLLDLRHEIHEKAVFHRVVQSAIAMVSRAILRLPENARPTLAMMYGLEKHSSPAIFGEDRFLECLMEASAKQSTTRQGVEPASQSIPQKLAERRIYRPLMVIPGDRVRSLLKNLGQIPDITGGSMEPVLRELAAIVDSEQFKPFFFLISKYIDKILEHSCDPESVNSLTEAIKGEEKLQKLIDDCPPKRVVFWAMPYKQLYKDPAILVCIDERVSDLDRLKSIEDVSESARIRVEAGIQEMESKYAAMWKLYVFLSDGLFYTGPLTHLFRGPCAENPETHVEHLKSAQILAIRAIRSAWDFWLYKSKPAELLNKTMTRADLSELLTRFVHHADGSVFYEEIRVKVAPVDVSRYMHSEDSSGQQKGLCSDIRYKYDLRPAHFDETLSSFQLPPQTHNLVRRVLEASQRDLDSFGEQQLTEIISRLSNSPRRLAVCFNEAVAQGEPPVRKDVLQSIWFDPEGDASWDSKTTEHQ